MLPIVLDAMGSDQRPDPEVQAAVEVARTFHEEIFLVGDEALLKPKLAALNVGDLPVRVIHAPEALDMSDHIEDARKKKQNSMRIGMEMVKAGKGSAFVTAGNTGMAMYFARKQLMTCPASSGQR